ncbi:MAG: TonB-dependent receptor [Saprospiraceae bacterium]|nr:TonB-dependent receptor [Saprospiraceae bacterium]
MSFPNPRSNPKKTVTIGASNERLLDVLQVICKPYRLTTEVIGNAIAIVSEKYDELDSEYIISGYIKDGRDGEVLPYTAVYLADRTAGVFSNEKGFYSFKLRRGNYQIIYAYVGYQEDTLQLFLRKDTTIVCKLKTENQLAEIVIEENLTRTTERYGETFYSKDRISTAMMFAGEADVIRTINSTAGVSTASDGFGGMSVRGGNYDQNLILYDGVPVQNTGHAFGLISIFNSSIIQDARLIKGGFPARYGGRLSSILDIKTRDGNNKAFKGEVSLSTIASRVLLEGPISKDKASFLLSYRRTFADPWIKELSQYIIQTGDAKGETSYYFDDINGKVSFALNPKHQLSFSYYKGRDALKNSVSSKKMSSNIEYDYNSINDQGWGNRLASIHLNSQLGKNMYSKLIAYTSKWENDAYNFRRFAVDSSSTIEDIYTADYKLSNLSNTGVRWDIDVQFSKGNIMRFGAGFIQNQYSPMFNLLSNVNNGAIYPEVIDKEEIKSRTNGASYQTEEILAYVEDEFDAGSNVVLNVGLHSSVYLFNGSRYASLQPRFSMNINGEASWFNFSSSMLRQYHQALSDNGLGFPSDQWVSASKWIKPADAINTSTTFGFLLSKNVSWSFGG